MPLWEYQYGIATDIEAGFKFVYEMGEGVSASELAIDENERWLALAVYMSIPGGQGIRPCLNNQ